MIHCKISFHIKQVTLYWMPPILPVMPAFVCCLRRLQSPEGRGRSKESLAWRRSVRTPLPQNRGLVF